MIRLKKVEPKPNIGLRITMTKWRPATTLINGAKPKSQMSREIIKEIKMKRIAQSALAATIIAVICIFTGCTLNDPQTPSEVVKAAYMAANNGNYEKADKYLSQELLSMSNLFFGGTKSIWDKNTHSKTLKEIEIMNEVVDGETAKINFIFHYQDESTKKENQTLKKVEGKWKMVD